MTDRLWPIDNDSYTMTHRKQMKIYGLGGVKYKVLDLGNKSYYDYDS